MISNAYSQAQTRVEDYIITMQGDTLYGKIRSLKDNKLRFESKNGIKVYKPAEVSRAYNASGNKIYASSSVQSTMEKTAVVKPVFAELIQEGEIAIYAFEKVYNGSPRHRNYGVGNRGTVMGPTASISVKYYAVKKSTGEIVEIANSGMDLFGKQTKKRAENLLKLIEDEAVLSQSLAREKSYNQDVFIRYIADYNKLKISQRNLD
ncbi:hypothetical protein U0038_09450 [Sphingobacterium spiritivorum]|uniref:Uncharacterized protein n=1 Tax=Sphingobacterium spiritivorum ATCC 33861 TaxID=525373 RepID=D7VT13_SPHSI|nr:hypothetical protein [Sphingobacterium spiritivorum]EFK56914.1 hypothetical protein HMPREF0766_14117 [Sphingobacterium spiritivorum ATCC 33861]QQT35070.1 hypothetical protein I6J01_17500 [Sphingobacterium spiritivorum]WQD35969.1 hypothetical protein U0038_09450 [Sphingobacterium spiritivorum]